MIRMVQLMLQAVRQAHVIVCDWFCTRAHACMCVHVFKDMSAGVCTSVCTCLHLFDSECALIVLHILLWMHASRNRNERARDCMLQCAYGSMQACLCMLEWCICLSGRVPLQAPESGHTTAIAVIAVACCRDCHRRFCVHS